LVGKTHHVETDMDHEVYHQELEEEKKCLKEDELKHKPRCRIHDSNGHNTVDCKTFIDPNERLVLVKF